MAGTLFGLPLSQQFDDNGDPLVGCLLYIFAAQTSTPSDTYADSGLTTLNAHPMEADASGRIPQFWVEDGSYRARLTTAEGVEVFDHDSILAIGPSVASTGGGGGGGAADATSVFNTGDMKWRPVTGSLTGWVRSNARTIGSASSGATERASSDTQSLYEFLWNNFSNALCPVATGRGANALADFAANKAIGTLDMRGRGIFGLDDMGNSAAGLLVTGTPTSAASATGAEKTTLAQANLPSVSFSSASLTATPASLVAATHTHGVGSFSGATHTHSFSATTSSDGDHAHTYLSPGTDQGTAAGGNDVSGDRFSDNTGTAGAHTHTVSGTTGASGAITISGTSAASGTLAVSGAITMGGTVPSGGSGTAATTISPGRLGSWYMKL